jgi:hypothetical protein
MQVFTIYHTDFSVPLKFEIMISRKYSKFLIKFERYYSKTGNFYSVSYEPPLRYYSKTDNYFCCEAPYRMSKKLKEPTEDQTGAPESMKAQMVSYIEHYSDNEEVNRVCADERAVVSEENRVLQYLGKSSSLEPNAEILSGTLWGEMLLSGVNKLKKSRLNLQEI